MVIIHTVMHFYRAAWNADRSSDENSIRSVRLSVKRVPCNKTEEKSFQIFIQYERSFCLFFWEEEWLVGATPSTRNFRSTGFRWSEIADFWSILPRSASVVAPSKKSLINRKSTTRYPMNLRWTSYVALKTPKGGLKTQNGRFPSEIALCLNKFCYKVSLYQNCQRESCKAFIGLPCENDWWPKWWTSLQGPR